MTACSIEVSEPFIHFFSSTSKRDYALSSFPVGLQSLARPKRSVYRAMLEGSPRSYQVVYLKRAKFIGQALKEPDMTSYQPWKVVLSTIHGFTTSMI